MAYLPVPIETEPVDLAADAFAYIQGKVPGWLPSPGNLEAWLVESLSQIASELRELTAQVPPAIFQYFGGGLLGIPPYQATSATGVTQWTAVDAAGYSVDAGTIVAISPPASTDSWAFQVVTDFTIPAGQTIAPGIVVSALTPGSAPSGITGSVQMVDPLDFIASVALTVPTSGGVDAEADDAYLTRLSNLFTLLAPRPILPQDFAVMAATEVPGVARATAIDLYNWSTSTANVPRCVTVVAIDSAGEAVSSTIKNQIDVLLQAQREVNFLVFEGDPTYNVIDVTFDLSVYKGYVVADVVTRATGMVTDYLSPAKWGLPPYGDTSAVSWINDTVVRYLELAEVLNRTDGCHYVRTLTLRKSGGTMATTDVTMTGIAPLPRPGTITGTGVGES